MVMITERLFCVRWLTIRAHCTELLGPEPPGDQLTLHSCPGEPTANPPHSRMRGAGSGGTKARTQLERRQRREGLKETGSNTSLWSTNGKRPCFIISGWRGGGGGRMVHAGSVTHANNQHKQSYRTWQRWCFDGVWFSRLWWGRGRGLATQTDEAEC